MIIRPAGPADLAAILELADAHRRLYATYEPVFWRPAQDGVDQQRPYLEGLLADTTVISVVAVSGKSLAGFVIGRVIAAPPVYDPGGSTCLIEDFAVVNPDDWPTLGADLLRTVGTSARQRGATQIVVVTGQRDAPKRAALAASGLHPASQWWVGTLPDGASTAPAALG